MIRLSKLTDYGFVLLTRIASSESERWFTARDLAESTGLPLPTVSKLLKVFSKGGILVAQRGIYGGYRLARSAESINVAEIIEVVDGPLAVTDCACEGQEHNNCSIEDHCSTKFHWVQITKAIRAVLADISLSSMARPAVTGLVASQAACHGVLCGSKTGEPCGCGEHNIHYLPLVEGAD